MTNRDFFRILIKNFGLYAFINTFFGYFPATVSVFAQDTTFGESIVSSAYFALILILLIAVFYFLIRFPDKLIDFFKLDQNFDNQRININNFNAQNILLLSLMIIGGFTLIKYAPSLLSDLYLYMKSANNPNLPYNDKNGINLIISLINVLIGAALITYRKSIASMLEKPTDNQQFKK